MRFVAWPIAVLAILACGALSACNSERKAECDQLLAVMKPMSQGAPSVDSVNRVLGAVTALKLQDQTLAVYAKNYSGTLTVLSKTLELAATPDAPDGTNGVIKTTLKDALTDADDAARYCAQ